MTSISARSMRILLLAVAILSIGCTAYGQETKQDEPTKPALADSPVDPSKYAVIVSGVSGEPQYAETFNRWTTELKTSLGQHLGFVADHINVLVEKPMEGCMVSNADGVKQTFERLKTTTKPDSSVFIFFIGHGTFDGKQAKFNLVGPDLSAADYAKLISELPAKHIVVINMSSASGEFIKPLSGEGRIIITATKNGQEQNATRFAESFIAALTNPEADADQNGRISILEAFNYASKMTAKYYEDKGILATEHSLISDNGDGVGKTNIDSGLAKTTYFDSLNLAQSGGDAEVAALVKEKDRLEREVELLKGRKASMKPEDYDAELEKLLVDLAKVNQSIKAKRKP